MDVNILNPIKSRLRDTMAYILFTKTVFLINTVRVVPPDFLTAT